ncbi:ABC transporter permease [Tessaracoccus sp. MC1865]|uniref:ABC transporter permease n=1 Tax=Tessaracoccus sp. MC1865 TaxID=2760310 RepID=UPI0016044089|nr:ABC transporter permease [Tessaracoccus sp. MC1865]MBB1482374.1 ABC transporter permease [Tessaracoccus sp. MC1865]QTO38161.1 ABC transporter permease [Tessaracoccus sp. MC1865]
MRWSDLLATSFASLRQRLFRTSLTVLGVLIGTTAVIVMVSLGVGLSSSFTAQFQNINLRQVSVSGAPAPEQVGVGGPTKMNEAMRTFLASTPGATAVWPVYLADLEISVGTTKQYLQIQGLPAEAFPEMEFELAWGEMPQQGTFGLLLGDKVDEQFWDPMTGMPMDIDFRTQTLFGTVTTWGEYGPVPIDGAPAPGDDPAAPPKPAKRHILPVIGELHSDLAEDQWGPYSTSVWADLDGMIEWLRKAMPGKALPNQPATSDGKPLGKDFIYTEFKVLTDSPEDAEAVLNTLRDQGYQAYAEIEWIRQSQEQGLIIQAVFGGIGFISLLVAAIGIANTMMMSVYERTREIGIMKVMGAALGDIRKMFLIEASSIGFFGGLIGLLLSLGVSAVLNATLGSQMVTGSEGGQVSIIPVWLMVGAVGFATLIGTVAGVLPAQRAMKLSPLAAIRAE